VLFDRVHESIKCDKIIIDDVGGAVKATNHLIELGCEKIALLTTEDFVTVGCLRKDGYKKALTQANIPINQDLIYKISDDISLYEQIKRVIFVTNPPDGIVAVNEIYAATAMKIAQERGLKIPEDIKIIGFTSGLISEFTSPPLSAVVQHGFTMGKQAAALLINRIEQKEPTEFQKEVISPNLKIRESTQKR
ncbi:MAG TPA: substrate-binding domain-containing protein, partial [Flavobacteriaceae bacterium]|nr:substrate-binding domain-containing protein [Flavobacteriaceae bacterium]